MIKGINMEEQQNVNEEMAVSSDLNNSQIQESAMAEEQLGHSELIMFQQNLKPQVKEMIMDLKKQFETEEGTIMQIMGTNPMMNNDGAYSLKAWANPGTSVNNMMSNYKEELIMSRMKDNMIEAASHLFLHLDQYDLDWRDTGIIINILANTVEPTYYRALNDGERKNQRSIFRFSEVKTPKQEKENKGIFGRVLGG